MPAFLRSLTVRGHVFIGLGVALLLTGLGLGMLDLTRIGVLLIILPLLTSSSRTGTRSPSG